MLVKRDSMIFLLAVASLAACGSSSRPASVVDAAPLLAEAPALLAYRGSYPDISLGFKCSGTVTASGRFILTANHCLTAGVKLVAYVGFFDRCATTSRLTPVDLGEPVAASSESIAADVALIPIDRPLKPAGITPTPDARLYATDTYQMTGWGWVPGTSLPCSPRRLDLAEEQGCSNDQFICLVASQANACVGDSGGGVSDNQGRLVAVTSYGESCTSGAPSMYGRLAPLKTWLSQATG